MPDALLVREAIKSERLPVEVSFATDGERTIDVLAKAESGGEVFCPDVLLLDLNLPKVDGFEVLRRVRASEKFKDLPVLVVTSSDSPADRAEAAKLGAHYFRKPVSYEEYLKVGAVLRQFLTDCGLI